MQGPIIPNEELLDNTFQTEVILIEQEKSIMNFINWEHSQVYAEKMYLSNLVKSGLITGTQQEVMINQITDKSETEQLIQARKIIQQTH